MIAGAHRIAATLTRLESILSRRGEPAAMAALGEPSFLDFLFQVLARRLVRLGPDGASDPLSPAGLVAAAERLAGVGALPASTAGALRAFLDALASSLTESGAWRADHAPWWQPLPPPGRLERLYGELEELVAPAAALPARESLREAFGGQATRRWHATDRLLPDGLRAELHRELEAALAAGELALEPGAVGAGRVSASRTDRVTYLDGLETEILARLPRLAVLTQWCLSRLAPELARRLPGTPPHPPATAMLARYPGPSGGYRPHLDNPGGPADNGRELALLLYLNPPGGECVGGELELWSAGRSPRDAADAALAPRGGALALLDARAVAHRVRPLAAGPARWSLALWLNREPQRAPPPPAPPELSLSEALLPVAAPPVPSGRLLWHELDDRPSGTIRVRRAGGGRPRVGIVATVYGAGDDLERWCRHHLGRGFDHLLLVFDRLEEPSEAETGERLRRRFPSSRLTIWSGAETARDRWRAAGVAGAAGAHAAEPALVRAARWGPLPQAVAARQTLNAGAALAAARGGELGGARLDWLLHLDADELFCFESRARGGGDPRSHFAALGAAGIAAARYVNHELLLPPGDDGRPRFKRHPRLAVAELGTTGWERLAAVLAMRPSDPRPYFNGYLNGKSAVAVAAGVAAAGVHDWHVSAGAAKVYLAGPSVLHFHFASAAAYWRKNRAMAAAAVPPRAVEELFAPCRSEVEGLELARALRRDGATDAEARRRLLRLRGRLTLFTPPEIELLEEAGLVSTPDLAESLAVDAPQPD